LILETLAWLLLLGISNNEEKAKNKKKVWELCHQTFLPVS